MSHKRLLASAATALLAGALVSCGGDGGAGRPARNLPTTERAQLAFFTTHAEQSEAIYDLGLSNDEGDAQGILTGGSIEGSVWPQLFTRLSWSPDGKRVAFGGGPGPLHATPDDRTDIYVIDSESSDVERLTEIGDAGDPVWAPDGETVVFTRLHAPERGPLRGDLWSVRADGSGVRRLAAAEDWESYSAGSFSPDGSRLAVTRSTFDPETGEPSMGIEVMNSDGSHAEELIRDASAPAFSPDGEQIAFVSDRDHNGRLCYGDRCFPAAELYVGNADGSDAQRLTETKALNEASPSWLPDGSRIAYQQGEVFQNAEAMSILVLNADGTCGRTILEGSVRGAWYASPAWRPSEPRTGGGRLSC